MILAYLFSAFFNGFGSESIYVILKLFLSYVFAIILIQFVITEGYKPLLNSFVYFSLLYQFKQLIKTSWKTAKKQTTKNRTIYCPLKPFLQDMLNQHNLPKESNLLFHQRLVATQGLALKKKPELNLTMVFYLKEQMIAL